MLRTHWTLLKWVAVIESLPYNITKWTEITCRATALVIESIMLPLISWLIIMASHAKCRQFEHRNYVSRHIVERSNSPNGESIWLASSSNSSILSVCISHKLEETRPTAFVDLIASGSLNKRVYNKVLCLYPIAGWISWSNLMTHLQLQAFCLALTLSTFYCWLQLGATW